jgi:trehalose/maltose transport system substrate-binding protein
MRLRLARTACVIVGAICVLVLLAAQSDNKQNEAARGITLNLIDQSWVDEISQERLQEELKQFTNETGIRVEVLPAPEAAVEQLAAWRKLLESGARIPDVYAIDVIWPEILADNLIDLKTYVPAEEVAGYFPELIDTYTVNGKLVALPFILNEGLLFYRVDLLREYGYRAPPKTWEELESMSRRIQAGERAKGNKDFWGYVWQGAPSEALTCNALEWQMSEGGGRILDSDGKVTVNNPHTIRAWDRAAAWVGSISPPAVVAYKEWDAFNVWQAGKAVFMRNWTNAYVAARAENSPNRNRFDIAPLPKGRTGVAATLGGNGYGVSRHSLHQREAVMLVHFLCSRDEQAKRCRRSAEPPTIPKLYKSPEVLAQNPYFSRALQEFRENITSRPSKVAGKMYPDVSRAYFEAVHAVLTQKKSAAQAAFELEKQLEAMLKTSAVKASGVIH